MASDLLKKRSLEREAGKGNRKSQAKMQFQVKLHPQPMLQGALECKLHHRSYGELVNYPTELVQPEGKGVSFPAPKPISQQPRRG